MKKNVPEFNAEHLRPLDYMQAPDPRWKAFGRVTEKGFESISLERYAQPIQEIALNEEVPKSVAVHFETAKNLALFAWHVYRFIPVAELYAFISVEFALREKTGDRKAPFKKILQRAIEEGWLSNEEFSQWKRATEQRAMQREQALELAKALDSEPPEDPQYWDYLAVLKEHIPYFRNNYAHGTSSISPWAYKALEDSAEIINQLFPSSKAHA